MNRIAPVVIMLACLAQWGCAPLTFTVGVSSAEQELESTVVSEAGGLGADRIAIIDVSGMILNGSVPRLFGQGENPVALFHEKLRKAADERRVKAVILRLNTPGGTVTATDVMYREVNRFKKRTGKPVVVLMMDIAASGGYYLACSSDYIVAYPSTITGSIGVIIQTISFKPAMDRIGIHAEAITSGKNKAAGSPFGDLTDEHRAVLKGLVSDMYARFTHVVREARPGIPADRFAELTDGRVMTGSDAVKVGIVDQVGDLYTAFDKAKELAGVERADLVLYHRSLSRVASPYASAGPATQPTAGQITGGTQINLLQINLDGLPGGARVGLYYLWDAAAP